MQIENFLGKEQVIRLESKEKQHVIKEMIEKLAELGLIKNKERYYAQVIHRESLENTGIGNGFAIPHARTDSVSEFISILGISEEGIDYQAIDGKPVRYILLNIFPSDMSTKYLFYIGMIARIFSNSEKRKLIDEESNPKKVYTLLKDQTKDYYESISEKSDSDSASVESLAGVPSSDLDLLIRLDRLFQMQESGEKIASLAKKIDELKKLIDKRSLTYYERMRKRNHNPFAVVEKDACTGCNMDIPIINIKQVKDGKTISLCTYCGRFLIIV